MSKSDMASIFLCIVVFGLLGAGIVYVGNKFPSGISLNSDQWTCTEWEQEYEGKCLVYSRGNDE